MGGRRVFDNDTYVYHWKPPLEHWQRLRVAELEGQAAAQLYKRCPGRRMWMRSGLHRINRWKNDFLRRLPLPGPWRRAVQVEEAYLRSGLMELDR